MDGGAWWATVHGVPKSQTRLSDSTFTFTIAILTNSFIGITENYTNVGAYIQAHLCVFQ